MIDQLLKTASIDVLREDVRIAESIGNENYASIAVDEVAVNVYTAIVGYLRKPF